MRHTSSLALIASIGPLMLVSNAVAQTASFADRTNAAGITGQHSPSYSAGFAAGGGVGDFNRDGFQDIFLASGGNQADRLFINNGDGTFTNRASEWGISNRHRGTGAAVGDFNGDGWLDLFVTSLGPRTNDQAGRHRLYRNDRGTGFTDVASAMGVNSTGGTADGWGGAFGDYDLDGDLDLAVCGWRQGSSNRLFRNDGATFTDVTASSGIAPGLAGISGFAAKFADMDGDRYPELIWIGDFSTSKYFRNNRNGGFVDVTGASGTANDGTEMGVTLLDANEDGQLDFYVTTINTNNLYINQGGNTFVNQASGAGVASGGWGWGAIAIDMNHDTRIDLLSTTQSGRQYAWLNQSPSPSNLQFSEVATSIGINTSVSGRGISNIDYDNDGDQDFVIFPSNGPMKLYRNTLSGPDTNWLRVFLDSGCAPHIAPDGIGSIVRATIGARTWVRVIDAGSNYLSNSELSAHFGLGAHAMVDMLRIEWPDGQVTTRTNVPVNQTLLVRAPSSAACTVAIGAGCAGANGVPLLEAPSGSKPALGSTLTMDLTGLDAGGAAAAMLFSFDRSVPGIDLAPIGMDGCRLYTGSIGAHALPLTNVGGAAVWSVAISNNAVLAGLQFVLQGTALDAGAPHALGVTMSNAVRAVVN